MSLKERKQMQVLMGLIEHFIKTGKAVGSNTLKESGLKSLSSATIRNYFADLEKEGYLHQPHVSGGRVPTEKAFRLYIENSLSSTDLPKNFKSEALTSFESKEIGRYLPKALETLSEITHLPMFMSTPRFDQDFLTEIKLIPVGIERVAALLITDFGVVKMELLPVDKRLNSFSIKRIEEYFHYRIHGIEQPLNLSEEEEEIAHHIYNELMLRFMIGHSQFQTEDTLRTGFSKLLVTEDFLDSHQLAATLALFENSHALRLIVRDCTRRNQLRTWIGEDLLPFSQVNPGCSVIAIPYCINHQPVGAIGIIGPFRVPYKTVIGTLKKGSDLISETLTNAIYKFKITYRQPDTGYPLVISPKTTPVLIEDRTKQGA